MMDQSTIRQAAILISSLDSDQADQLLLRLDPTEAQRIREAVSALTEEDLLASQEVIEDFLASYTKDIVKSNHTPHEDSDIEGNASVDSVAQIASAKLSFRSAESLDLQCLYQVSPPVIAQFLGSMHTQIAATILTHVPPDFSGIILSYLPPAQQNEILDRISNNAPCPSTQLHTIFNLLSDCLLNLQNGDNFTPQQTANAIEVASHDNFLHRTLSAIEANGTELSSLEHWNTRKRNDGPIEACSRSLLQNTSHTSNIVLKFDDITLLDDKSLARLFHQVEHEVLLLALAGATPEIVQRITSPLAPQQVEKFAARLESISGVSLQQIDDAQQSIALQASKMANENAIHFIEQKRFQAAA